MDLLTLAALSLPVCFTTMDPKGLDLTTAMHRKAMQAKYPVLEEEGGRE